MVLGAVGLTVSIAFASLLALAPGSSQAQPAHRLYRIGALTEAFAPNHPAVEGLKAGLKELGLEEGRDVVFDIRFTEGNYQAMPAAAAALVKAGVDLIFTTEAEPTQAAQAATRTIPIVFSTVGDPVASGLVAEVARPGGNVTGVSTVSTDLVPKRLEILKELVPSIRRLLIVYEARNSQSLAAVKKAEEAARQLGLKVVPRPVGTVREVADALNSVRPGDALFHPHSTALDIPALVLKTSLSARVPAVFPAAFWVSYGGLISYGADYHAAGAQAARLVARILRGSRPQDLPVEAANRIELAVNLKTAGALGINVPREILLRANQVVE